jgi:hypothetical protein
MRLRATGQARPNFRKARTGPRPAARRRARSRRTHPGWFMRATAQKPHGRLLGTDAAARAVPGRRHTKAPHEAFRHWPRGNVPRTLDGCTLEGRTKARSSVVSRGSRLVDAKVVDERASARRFRRHRDPRDARVPGPARLTVLWCRLPRVVASGIGILAGLRCRSPRIVGSVGVGAGGLRSDHGIHHRSPPSSGRATGDRFHLGRTTAADVIRGVSRCRNASLRMCGTAHTARVGARWRS